MCVARIFSRPTQSFSHLWAAPGEVLRPGVPRRKRCSPGGLRAAPGDLATLVACRLGDHGQTNYFAMKQNHLV